MNKTFIFISFFFSCFTSINTNFSMNHSAILNLQEQALDIQKQLADCNLFQIDNIMCQLFEKFGDGVLDIFEKVQLPQSASKLESLEENLCARYRISYFDHSTFPFQNVSFTTQQIEEIDYNIRERAKKIVFDIKRSIRSLYSTLYYSDHE